MSVLNVLLVGCGEHSAENLMPSLLGIPSVCVKGVCDPVPSAVSSARRLFTHASVIDKEFLGESDLLGYDVIVAAGPPQVHEHVAGLAIKSGLPVFVEKPPTVTTDALEVLAEQAEKRKIITCVGHNLRHSDAAIQFHSAVGDPGFGRPVAMEMRYLASKPRGVRWGLGSSLRSFLLSHANHAIDLMIYQMGDLKEVVAARAYPDVDGGIAMTSQFIFKSGAVGSLFATSYSPHFMVSTSVVSDSGSIATMKNLQEVEVFSAQPSRKRWRDSWSSRTLETGFYFAGYQTELERFFSGVINGTPHTVHPSFADEVAIYHAMDAIEDAVKSAGS